MLGPYLDARSKLGFGLPELILFGGGFCVNTYLIKE